MKRVKTFSENETYKLGFKLGELLHKGDIVCLDGDLGAGKTVLTKGIAEALGVKECVTSPTFTILNEYEGKTPLYHFDAYRISDDSEMLDFEEYFFGGGVVIIEWAILVKDAIPDERIEITLKKLYDDERQIDFKFIGTRLKQLEKIL